MNTFKKSSLITGLGIAAVAIPALASAAVLNVGVTTNVNVAGTHANATATAQSNVETRRDGMPGIFTNAVATGKITAINGTTLTVAGRGFGNGTATTSYTVDASGAVVVTKNATSSVSSLKVGDNVLVQGSVSGTMIKATTIRTGIAQGNDGDRDDNGNHYGWRNATSSDDDNGHVNAEAHVSVWASIGNWFKGLFGHRK